MTISSAWVDELLAAELPKGIDILGDFLASEKCSMKDLAILGANLGSIGQFTLAELVFKRWSEITPKNPEPWTNHGLCLSRQKKFSEARFSLEHALKLDSNYVPAMNNLGEVYQELGEHELQLKICLLAVNKCPDSSIAFNNLGSALVEIGMFKEASHAFETSTLLDPNSFNPRFNLAKELSFSGNSSAAIQQLEYLKSGGLATTQRQSDMLDFQLGMEYLTCGRLVEGWQLYEKGFSSAIPAALSRSPYRQFSVPMWHGQSLSNKERLMIWREQGVGDEIRFAALLPLLPEAIRSKLVLECDPRLVDLFSRSMPEIAVRPDTETIDDFDYHLPIGSLPRLLMSSIDVLKNASPVIHPNAAEVAKFASRLAEFKDKKLIGICWRSHKLSATRNKKYTALEDWAEILSIPDVVFVNLQYGECEEEVQEVEYRLGVQIQRWSDLDLMNDFDGIAALIKNLDLVISVSSAVVPLAGAIGVPTICMMHNGWVMLGQQNVYPWFSSVIPFIVEDAKPIASVLTSVANRIKL